jgi:hypothetical protein
LPFGPLARRRCLNRTLREADMGQADACLVKQYAFARMVLRRGGS